MTTYNPTMNGVNAAGRDEGLDLICGLLIVHMIIGHISLMAGVNYALWKVLFFFMPWFFFRAGMHHRAVPLKQCLISSAKRLLVPFAVFSLLGEAVRLIGVWKSGGSLDISQLVIIPVAGILKNGSVAGNLPLWFLLTLFLVKAVFNILVNKKGPVVGVMTMAFIAATIANFANGELPLYCENFLSGMGFYSAGYLLKQRQYSKLWFGLSVAVVGAIALFCPASVDMRTNNTATGIYWVWIIYCLGGIVMIDNLARLYPPHKSLITSILQHVGRYSMSYYVLHWVVMVIVTVALTGLIPTTGWIYWVCMTVACLCVLPVADYLIMKYIPAATGMKPAIRKRSQLCKQ